MKFNGRLIAFWNRCKGAPGGHIWGGLIASYQGPLVSALESGNVDALDGVLANLGTIAYGLDDPYQPIIPWESPRMKSELEGLGQVDRADLQPPNCFGFDFAKGTSARMLHYSSIGSTILSTLGSKPRTMLEIGAGLGFMGFIAHRWSTPYTVIDLPSVAVMSAHFMSKVCGQDNVWFWGEPDNPESFARFYPSNNYRHTATYQVVLNHNSFPEMSPEARAGYMGFIKSVLPSDGFFISVNHEERSCGQGTVRDAATNLTLVSRTEFRMRHGYFEEIYK